MLGLSRMVTVQHLVKKELDKNQFLIELLQQELINISALALKLQPAIEKELGQKVKTTAIGMALRRYAAETSQKTIFHVAQGSLQLEISREFRSLYKITDL